MPDNVQNLWSEDDLDTALATLRSDVDTDRRALARARADLLTAAGAAEPPAGPPPARGGRHWS
jgi:hypothetical protein